MFNNFFRVSLYGIMKLGFCLKYGQKVTLRIEGMKWEIFTCSGCESRICSEANYSNCDRSSNISCENEQTGTINYQKQYDEIY